MCRLLSLHLYIAHFGPAHLNGSGLNSVRQLVISADLVQDLGELSFGREIMENGFREALIFTLPAFQALVCFFGYSDGLGGH
jgi:hypothetical protein